MHRRSKKYFGYTPLEILSLLENDPRNVFIHTKFRMIYGTQIPSTKYFYISSENLGYDYQAFALQKHSLLKEPFDILWVIFVSLIVKIKISFFGEPESSVFIKWVCCSIKKEKFFEIINLHPTRTLKLQTWAVIAPLSKW